MKVRQASAVLFGSMLVVLLVANFGCSVDEAGEGSIAGTLEPAIELRTLRQDSLGNPTGFSVDATPLETPLSFQVIARPGSAGFDLQNEGSANETIVANFQVFCNQQLGDSCSLPGAACGAFGAIPAFRRGIGQEPGNELEILRAVAAAGLDRRNMALPAGFNLATLFTPDSPDTRADATTVTLTWNASRAQAPVHTGVHTFSASVVDKSGQVGARRHNLTVSRNTQGS